MDTDQTLLVVVPADVPAYVRRQELSALVLKLMQQRIAANTVVGSAGITFGTAARIVADAKLFQAELDKAAPI